MFARNHFLSIAFASSVVFATSSLDAGPGCGGGGHSYCPSTSYTPSYSVDNSYYAPSVPSSYAPAPQTYAPAPQTYAPAPQTYAPAAPQAAPAATTTPEISAQQPAQDVRLLLMLVERQQAIIDQLTQTGISTSQTSPPLLPAASASDPLRLLDPSGFQKSIDPAFLQNMRLLLQSYAR